MSDLRSFLFHSFRNKIKLRNTLILLNLLLFISEKKDSILLGPFYRAILYFDSIYTIVFLIDFRVHVLKSRLVILHVHIWLTTGQLFNTFQHALVKILPLQRLSVKEHKTEVKTRMIAKKLEWE